MARRRAYAGLSDLETEVELDMEGEPPEEENGDEEVDGQELDDKALGEAEPDEEVPEEELEEPYDETRQEKYIAGDPRDQDYAERFLELSRQSFESEDDLDRELHEILGDAERDYFFRKAWRRLKKSAVLRGALRSVAQKVAGRFPALKAVTQLARGNLKGLLATAAKTALAGAVPGGSLLLTELGFQAAGDSDRNGAAWHNYAQMTREAYETLADQLHDGVDQPLQASVQAANAFQQALQRAQARSEALARGVMQRVPAGSRRMRRVIWLEPGQTLVIRTRPR
jgi:hypothetical protein